MRAFISQAQGRARYGLGSLGGKLLITALLKRRVLIFDLDGTLIDSKLDLAHAVNATLAHMKREPLSPETIYGYVGNGAPMLVRRALGDGTSDQEADTGLAHFLSYYRAHMLDNTVPYPGVREGLALLEQHPMAVLTNKPVHFSRAILDGLGLMRYFRYVYGGNSFATKKLDPPWERKRCCANWGPARARR